MLREFTRRDGLPFTSTHFEQFAFTFRTVNFTETSHKEVEKKGNRRGSHSWHETKMYFHYPNSLSEIFSHDWHAEVIKESLPDVR